MQPVHGCRLVASAIEHVKVQTQQLNTMQPPQNKLWNPISLRYWSITEAGAPRHVKKRMALDNYFATTEVVKNTEVYLFPGCLPHLRCSQLVDTENKKVAIRHSTKRDTSEGEEVRKASKYVDQMPMGATARGKKWLADHRFPAKAPDNFKWSTPESHHASHAKEKFSDPATRRPPYSDYKNEDVR